MIFQIYREISIEYINLTMNWILEADITSFFDSLDHILSLKMPQEGESGGSFLRLVGKCLHEGVLESGEFSILDRGIIQGS